MIDNFALIIGAMKCGTTSLFRYLSEHPQIATSQPKEVHFFSKDTNYCQGFEWYQQSWDYNPHQHQVALEASTSYTTLNTPQIINRIATIQANHQAKFRFIYIMRNPIERIESHYTHAVARNWTRLNQDSPEVPYKAIKVSQYAGQLEEYYQKFSSNDILLLNFEDLKENPKHLLWQVCQFLEVDTSFEFKNTSKNYHPSVGKVIHTPMWSMIEPLTKPLPAKPRKIIRKYFGQRIEEKIKLSPQQRNFVVQELREDLQKLSGEYGFDISRWGLEI